MNHEKYLRRCYQLAASYSDDPSTQNGAILVAGWAGEVATGVNHFPEGVVKTAERLERPLKYSYMEHAERDAIYNAAKWGVVTEGLTMYCPWSACDQCARAIVLAGIIKMVRHQSIIDKSPERWKESIAIADGILTEGGVEIENYVGDIGGVTILFDGEPWNP
jgi:dCMP deaminase